VGVVFVLIASRPIDGEIFGIAGAHRQQEQPSWPVSLV